MEEKPQSSPVTISQSLFRRLRELGIIDEEEVRKDNHGESDYSKHLIQPWAIWMEYNLNPFDADIIKRVLRKKGKTSEEISTNRIMDYQKIIHICQERLRQLNTLHNK